MKGFIIFLTLASAFAVLVEAFPQLQSRSTPNNVQTKRQSSPTDDPPPGYDDNYYSLKDTIDIARGILYAYDPLASLVSVLALPEDQGTAATLDMLTDLTFTAVNYFNGSLITMTAHHGYGFGVPETSPPVPYEYLLSFLPLPWPIDIDAPTAFNHFNQEHPGNSPPGTTYGAFLHFPSFNIGPYNVPEVVWTFYFGSDTACSVPASASVAGKFLTCVG